MYIKTRFDCWCRELRPPCIRRMVMSSWTLMLLVLLVEVGSTKAFLMDLIQFPMPAQLGNQGYTVRATYTIETSERFRFICMTSKGGVYYACLFSMDEEVETWWIGAPPLPLRLRGRATPYGSQRLHYLEIKVVNTTCLDSGSDFTYHLGVAIGGKQKTLVKSHTVSVRGETEAPDTMQEQYPQRTAVVYLATAKHRTFSCTAIVADSSGAIMWYAFTGDNELKNLTSQATQTVTTKPQDPTCAVRRKSTLSVLLSSAEFGAYVTILCAVNHPEADPRSCASAADFCQKSSVYCFTESRVLSLAPDPMGMTVDLAPLPECLQDSTDVTFSCSSNVGYPPASVLWYAVNEDNTIRNLTDRAKTNLVPLTEQDPDCSSKVRSVLELRLRHGEFPSIISVRCFVDHPQLNPVKCSVPSSDFCQKSPKFCVAEGEEQTDDYNPASDTPAGRVTDGTAMEITTVKESTGTSTATIVLALIGTLAFVTFIAVAICIFMRRMPTRRRSAHYHSPQRRASVSVQYNPSPAVQYNPSPAVQYNPSPAVQYAMPVRRASATEAGPPASPVAVTFADRRVYEDPTSTTSYYTTTTSDTSGES